MRLRLSCRAGWEKGRLTTEAPVGMDGGLASFERLLAGGETPGYFRVTVWDASVDWPLKSMTSSSW